MFDSKYEITGYLNKGFRAAVYKAVDKSTGKHVSVKKLLKSDNLTSHMRDLINREVTIQYMLPDHPNICQSHGHFDTRRRYIHVIQVLIVTEICGTSTVYEQLSDTPMSEHRVRNIVRQVVAGAEALEKASIFHMDLWSANWLIDVEDNDRVKIIDFGVAAITDERVNEMPPDFPIVIPEFLTTKSARPSSFAPWAMSLCIFSLIFKREAFGLNRDFSNIIDRR